jgi:predicted component of type VI protein secretion system
MSFKYTDYKLDKIIFSEMNMFNINSIDDYHSSELTSKERVNVRMPQLLFVAQLNHYLRMIRRQSFARDDIRELRRELTDWLKLYISDEYVASDEIKLYKPLKSADVKLSSNASGETTFSLNIVPHSKFRGLEYSISL